MAGAVLLAPVQMQTQIKRELRAGVTETTREMVQRELHYSNIIDLAHSLQNLEVVKPLQTLQPSPRIRTGVGAWQLS